MSNYIVQQIRKIQKQPKLSSIEKQKKIQKIMSENNKKYMKPKNNDANSCNHYIKNCSQFSFNCCSLIDPCKRCHLDRHSMCENCTVKTITCIKCKTQQTPSNMCINCSVKFAKNYCEKCNIWTDKQITHCDKCNICRLGTNLFHCDTCNICFENDDNLPHKCTNIDFATLTCSVCTEKIFNTTEKIHVLACTHAIHDKCLIGLLNNDNYKCPLCKKSMIDMTLLWDNLNANICQQPMPKLFSIRQNTILNSPFGKFECLHQDQYNKSLYHGLLLDIKNHCNNTYVSATLHINMLENILDTEIICNDCNQFSNSKYHYLGIKCYNCGSYNTCKL